MSALRAVDLELQSPRKLDIGSGRNRRDGYTGIDLEPSSDIVWDLWRYPWPIKAGAVREVNVSHLVEHIPHYRHEWSKDGWFMFWEEVWRITRKGALIHVVSPHVRNDRAFWDPTHERFIQPMNYVYLDPAWRDANGLGHYTTCDFEVLVQSYTGESDDIAARADEAKAYAHSHYWNSTGDLVVELRRR